MKSNEKGAAALLKTITLRCPECNAKNNVEAGAETLRCEYCGTTARVQGRSALGIPRALAPPRADEPQQVAKQELTLKDKLLLTAVLGGLALFILGAIGTSIHSCLAERTPRWGASGGMALLDVNGDGVLDMIGRLHAREPEQRAWLGAFDGRQGEELWVSEPLGAWDKLAHSPLGVVGDTVVWASDGSGELLAIKLSDGTTRWKIQLPEVVERLCAGDTADMVAVTTKDKRSYAVALASGERQPREQQRRCVPLITDLPAVDQPHRMAVERPKLEGIDVSSALRHVPSGVTLAIGRKRPGSGIPMIARFRLQRPEHPESKPRAEVLWSTVIPASDPLNAEGEADRRYFDLDGEASAVAYKLKDSDLGRLALFELGKGARRWDIQLESRNWIYAVTLTDRFVLVSRFNGLFAHRRDTGKLAFVIGEH